jgi:phenylalanyl-tRNA synthetase beta chain
MKISYDWLKWYIPEVVPPEKLVDVITGHLCEVDGVLQKGDDFIFDLKILPDRAHDLLSHQGVAHELASLLNIKFIDPTPKYKVPESKPTQLVKKINTPFCRRYMGRIIRNIKIGPSPEWVVKHLESIGQRSINNIVDATNITMFDCGQPTHVFDLAKIKDSKLQVRNAKNGEKIALLGGGEKILSENMLVIADEYGNSLDIAGIKGGKYAELTMETTDIVLEAANFNPVSVRKTAQALNIFTEARKRFENDLSPELDSYGMLELSALIAEMCPEAIFEDVVDIYPEKQEKRKLTFSTNRISEILGLEVSAGEVRNILDRYGFEYSSDKEGIFEITVPSMRLDLVIEEDMAEEIGRVIGYDQVKPKIPHMSVSHMSDMWKPKFNDTYAKISFARNKLLDEGYSEVMTYVFRDNGEVEVLASASDKKFLRTNLADGLLESFKLNKLNAPLLGSSDIKIFEIGTVFLKDKEEMHVAYNEGDKIIEVKLDDFISHLEKNSGALLHPTGGTFRAQNFSPSASFKMWSLFPFISRDISVWLPEGVDKDELKKILVENGTDLLIKEPCMVDSFVGKDGRTSYAFRLVFQSYDRTLTDVEVSDIMTKITNKIKENSGWQVR